MIDLAIYHVFFLGAMADSTKICTVEGNAAVEMGAVERRIIHGELWKEELSMMSWHLMMEDDMSITWCGWSKMENWQWVLKFKACYTIGTPTWSNVIQLYICCSSVVVHLYYIHSVCDGIVIIHTSFEVTCNVLVVDHGDHGLAVIYYNGFITKMYLNL